MGCIITNLYNKIQTLRALINSMAPFFPAKFGKKGRFVLIGKPSRIANPQNLFIDDFVNIRVGFNAISTKDENIYIKKYSVISPGCTVITNSHVPTVGVPQYFLGESHINDKSGDVIIDEDVWVGANCTILAHVHIGRGAKVGACALVTKDVPPYALVVGSPARIVGSVFSKEGIIKHELKLYDISDRLSLEQIDSLFDLYFKDKKTFGIEDEMTESQKEILSLAIKRRGLDNVANIL